MKKRGGILILVLIVLTVLTATLALGIRRVMVNSHALAQKLDKQKARLQANSGIQYAVAQLQLQAAGAVLQSQDWYTVGQNGDEKFNVSTGSFRLQIVDDSSLLNLNTADDATLLNLPISDDQRQSLEDWRTSETTPAQPNGAKDDYYLALTVPYNIHARRMSSIDELLLIKDWNAQTLYTTDTQNTSSTATTNLTVPIYSLVTVDSFSGTTGTNGAALPDINSATAQQLTQDRLPATLATQILAAKTAAGGRFTSWRQVLGIPGMTNANAGILLDRYQIGGATAAEGKINLNTVSEQVLDLIPNLSPDIATAIVSYQSTGFNTLSDIFKVAGFSVQMAAATADLWTVSSQIFRIRVEGTSGSAHVSQEAIVSIQGNRARVLKIYDAPLSDMKTMWNWNQDTSSDTTVGAS